MSVESPKPFVVSEDEVLRSPAFEILANFERDSEYAAMEILTRSLSLVELAEKGQADAGEIIDALSDFSITASMGVEFDDLHQEQRLKQTYIHEAGHAYLAALFGMRVDSFQLPDKNDPHGDASVAFEIGPADLLGGDLSLVAAAGPCVELVFTNGIGARPSDDMGGAYEEAMEHAMYIISLKYEEIAELASELAQHEGRISASQLTTLPTKLSPKERRELLLPQKLSVKQIFARIRHGLRGGVTPVELFSSIQAESRMIYDLYHRRKEASSDSDSTILDNT